MSQWSTLDTLMMTIGTAILALAFAAHGQVAGEAEAMDAEVEQMQTGVAAAPPSDTPSEAADREPVPMTAQILPEPSHTVLDWGVFPAFSRPDWTEVGHDIYGKPDVQQWLYEDLGMTLMRTKIEDRGYDAEADDGSLDTGFLDLTLLKHLQIARDHGIDRYMISVWSPPTLFKDPPIRDGKDDEGNPTRLREDREDDYVQYIVSVFDYLRERGIDPPVAFSVQNELSYPASWDGTVYEPEQYRRVAKAFRKAFDENGYEDVLLVGPESGSYAGNIPYLGESLSVMKEDEELRDAIDVIAFHGYGGEWSARPDVVRQMRGWTQAAQAMGKEAWMTEISFGSAEEDMTIAMKAMRRLAREMTYVPVNRWIWWSGWHREPKNTALITSEDPKAAGNPPYRRTLLYWALHRLWNEAAPPAQARRVQTTDDHVQGFHHDTVEAVAFESGERTVVLLINPDEAPRDLLLEGLGDAGEARVYQATRTSERMNPVDPVAVEAGTAQLTLPADSITIVATGQDPLGEAIAAVGAAD